MHAASPRGRGRRTATRCGRGASSTPTANRSGSARCPRARLALALEVLGRDLVEELLEPVDDLLGVLDLVLELDRRLGDDVLGREDGRAGAHGEGERVARARVDLELAAVHGQRD